jgi:Protein of unknown function (DUF1553)/Protein of unknown function (DUF1549)/Concanavalin A-like lectin/glucanases superfamily/Planctomycete cytochrome C
MIGWRVGITGAISGAVLSVVVLAGQTTTARPAPVDFTTQIRPLLSDRCFRCHGPDASKRKAELRLDVPAGARKNLDNGWAVVKPGNPERSELIRRIFADDDDLMPPSESHLSLTDGEKTLLLRWVKEGADYRPHWAFLPVRSEPPPRRPAEGSSTNPIDTFIATRLADAGLRPAPEAARETFIRRAALTLTGLPPTPAEIDAFLADTSPKAFEHAVDRYLASPAYGERMAMDWLDLARYADTYGYQADVDRDMSPYRDWVIRAFNDNLPYDQFLTWQLAGDLLPRATRDQRIATAFNRLHRQTNEGGSIEEEFRTEYAADRVNTFGTAMLGLTLECARCHDHKFDPITQRDYFSLFAFFNNIDESGLYSHYTNATPTPALLLWPAGRTEPRDRIAARIAETERHLKLLARSARGPFERWIGGAQLHIPAPVAHLAFDAVDAETTPERGVVETTPDRVAAEPARLQDGPQLVREPSPSTNGALRFSGDNSVVHPGAPTFVRTDPFSLSIRLMPTEEQPRAVVVHQSRAWTDAGSRGFELTLDRGRPFFGLIHFWPGNAIAVRATRALPLKEWSRLTVTYDGSSRAAGIRLYLNGAPLATDVVRDQLVKDISYRPEAGDRSADTHPLTLAARFRDSGFKNGLIDDLQIFNVQLTAAEVAALPSEAPSHFRGAKDGRQLRRDADAFEYFLAREYQPFVDSVKTLRRLRQQADALVADVPEIMVMEDMHPPRQTRLLKRGAYDAPGDLVERDTPAALPPFPTNQPRNRLGLARWLTSPEHPLAARVVVNRVWRMHFGRGIVATPEDFGSQGKLPTHPELLDWLTDRFMKQGWDVKALHRRIVLSATFRQSSVTTAEAAARDPENHLLSRWPKTRLLAEQIRDSALAASGLLNRTIGGPSVKPYQPAGLWEQSGTGKTYKQDTGLKLYRRSLYTFWRRTAPPPSMTAFDAVTREVCVARREATVTPLQSLVLLNDPQFVEASRALAERLLKRHPQNARARHGEAFRGLTGRLPDETEAGILAQMFEEQHQWFARHPADALKFVSVGDSAPDPSMPPAALAAMTAVVNAIVNFDEYVVLR